jgi:DNA-directed RNA polymerase sigma subunit (sigma70/sigma32)
MRARPGAPGARYTSCRDQNAPAGTSKERQMSDRKDKSMEAIRKEVHTLLANLTPQEAKALRARFKIDLADERPDEAERQLQDLARELARLKKKR